jgi:hypothetical protein
MDVSFQNFQWARVCAEDANGHGLGALPPLVSVTAVRVLNFTAYNWTKDKIDDTFKQFTGVSPLEEYNKPGSTPSVPGLITFITAGLAAGLFSSPLACMILARVDFIIFA